MERIFRGKTFSQDEHFDDGEWVEGYYTCFNGKEHRIYSGYAETDCGDYYPDWFNVRPETVGQYTGRNVGADKLFEGDIIEWVEDYDDNWGDSKTYIGRSLVIWDNDNSCWAVKTDTYIQFFNDFSWDRCYVIGNIHDNPEMLEVK